MVLRSVLPPRGPSSPWMMNSVKEEELKRLWSEVVDKEKEKKKGGDDDDDDKEDERMVSVSGLKSQMTAITKNAGITRKMYVNE